MTTLGEAVDTPPRPTIESTGDEWRRHPADVARLALASVVLGVLALAAWVDPDGVRELSADLAAIFRNLPEWLQRLLLGLAQLAAAAAPLVLLGGLLVRRRWRLLATTAVAATVASVALALVQGWLDRVVPPEVLVVADEDSWLTGASFPSGAYLAGATAALVVIAAAGPRSWRRTAWLLLGLAATARAITVVAVPLNLGITIALGAVVGSAVLVAGGAPRRRITRADVVDGLAAAGWPTVALDEVDLGARHARTFTAVGEGGDAAFVKLVGRDERNAEVLLRIVRTLRVRGLEEERPGWSPERVVEHEALAASLARRAGARVTSPLAVGTTADGDGLVVLEAVPGRPLTELHPDEIDDDLLRELWRQVAALRARRIAHRWCDASHVLVDDAGRPTLLDTRWAVLSADDRLLAIDVATLATSLALIVGPSRAVATAAEVLPADALADALPLAQPLVLPAAVRRRVRRTDLLEQVRAELQRAAGVEEYRVADIARVSVGRVVGLVGTAVLVYVALAFASNWSAISAALGDADWSYVPAILIFAFLGFPGGAVSLMGAVPDRLPFLQTTQIMFAQSFLNRFTPANAGGMALRARYLQANGADLPVAAASVGITSLASGVLQGVLLVVFAVWAGDEDALRFELPDASTVAVAILVVLVVAGAVMATPWGRRVIFGPLRTSVAKVWGELSGVAARPQKLALLFGGAFIGKITTILAFTQSCRAFDVDLAFPHLALLYMTANTVASAAPTPGGLGAIEAALVAVLTGAGVEPAVALSIVLVFRLATFWLPVPPSYLALADVRRRGVV